MRKNLITSLVLLLLGCSVFAQQVDFSNYHPLKSTGTLPENFSATVYKGNSSRHQNKKSKKKATDDEEFELESAYSLNRFLRSGALVFNDPVSAYVEKVLKVVLEANGISEKMHCHLIRTTSVNAYAIHENRIFITAGLIAQLTNEAQLAFIISHEFIHYRNRHAIESFRKSKSVERDYKRYRGMSYYDKKDVLFRYSREVEMEADKEGTGLFLHTGYSLQGPDQAFDVLQFGQYPFEEIPFDKNFLETAYLKFPKEYFLDKVDEIVADEDEGGHRDEENSTHPNLQRRRGEVQAVIGDASGEGRKDFIVSEAEFYQVRKICRFELCRMYLQEREYERALYSAYILLKEDSNSLYLKKTVAKALYGLSSYANKRKFSKVHHSVGRVSGNEQQVTSLMDNLTNEELTLTALNYTWRAHQQFPGDVELTKIADELFKQTVNEHSISRFSLKTAPKDTSTVKVNEEAKDTVQHKPKKNKYASIKTKSDDGNRHNESPRTEFIMYGFVDLLQDKEFTERFDYHWNKKEERQEREQEERNSYSVNSKNKKNSNKYREDKTDLDEEVDKLVYFDPYSVKIDLRKDRSDMYVATDKKRERLIDNLETLTKSVGIKQEVILRNEVGSDDVELYNDICLISDFIGERFEHDDKVEMLPVDYEELMKFSKEYDSPYIAVPGSLLVVEQRPPLVSALNIFAGLILWPYLPYAIYKAATPRYTTIMYLAVFNVETGKLSFADVVEIQSRDGSDLVNSQLFDMLMRMKLKNY